MSGNSIDCEGAPRALTLTQDRFDGHIVATWFEQEQAVAQTFTVPAPGLQLAEFAPTFDYALGRGATVSIHHLEDPRDPMSGRELAISPLDALAIPSGLPATIRLAQPVPLACGGVYSMVVRPERDSELAVLSTVFTGGGNVYPAGAMFIGGPGRWEPTGGDMWFEVALEPAATNG